MSIDQMAPTIELRSDKTFMSAGGRAQVTFELSDPSKDFSLSDVTVTNGILSNFKGSGSIYTATFTPLPYTSGTGKVSVGSNKFTSAAGNPNLDGADLNNRIDFAFDGVFPEVKISASESFTDSLGTTITFSLSEPSNTFDQADVVVSGGSISEFAALDPKGRNYTARFTPDPGKRGTATIEVPEARFLDLAQNPNYGAQLSLDFDTNLPTDALFWDWTRVIGTPALNQSGALAPGPSGDFYMVGTSTGDLEDASSSSSLVLVENIILARYSSDGNPIWQRSLAGTVSGEASGLCVSNDGSLYVVGSTNPSSSGQQSVGLVDCFIAKFTANGTPVWTRILGTRAIDQAVAVSAAPDDSVYVAGFSYGELGNQRNRGQSDAFVAKFTGDGSLQWTRLLGGESADRASAIAAAADGSVYLAGTAGGGFEGKLSQGADDAFLAKLDPNGALIWTRLIGTAKDESATALATGLDGSIYLSGSTEGNLSSSSPESPVSQGGTDVFITKFASNGAQVWSEMLGSPKDEFSSGLAISDHGSVYIVGMTKGNLDQREILLAAPAVEENNDAYLARYDQNGVREWTRQFGTPLEDQATTLALGAQGDLFVSGVTAGNLHGSKQNGSLDIFLSRFAPLDDRHPQIEIKAPLSGLNAGDSTTISFLLSEPSANFTASDVVVFGGSLSDFVDTSGDGRAFNAKFTPATNTAVALVQVPSGAFSDNSLNLNIDGDDANNRILLSVEPPSVFQRDTAVFLPPSAHITLSSSNLKVYGSSTLTREALVLDKTCSEVAVDQNVEAVYLHEMRSADLLFQQTGNRLNVFNTQGSKRILTVAVQSDSDGTQLVFSDGAASAQMLADGSLQIAGRKAQSSVPALISSPLLTQAPPLPTGDSNAKVYLANDETFVVRSNKLAVFGASGVERIQLDTKVVGIDADLRVDQIELLGRKAEDLRFQQDAADLGKLSIHDSSSGKIATTQLQADRDGTQLIVYRSGGKGQAFESTLVASGIARIGEILASKNSTVPISKAHSISATQTDVSATELYDDFNFMTGPTAGSRNYRVTISGSFESGDRLVFPAAYSALVLDANSSASDGTLRLSASDPNTRDTIGVTLTGIPAALDARIYDIDSFRSNFAGVFG